MKRLLVYFSTVLFETILVLSLFNFASAENLKAGDIKVSTPNYSLAKSKFKPEFGTYRYSIGWKGIPAAEATIEVSPINRKEISITSLVKTYKAIDLFYKVRYEAGGILSQDTFEPKMMRIVQRENSRFKQSNVLFVNRNTIKAINLKNKNAPEEYVFHSKNLMLEPLSAAFKARGLDWPVGTVRDFDAFNGKSRYLISLRSEREDVIEFQGKKRRVWVLKPRVWNLVKTSHNKKIRDASIYLTQDSSREILKLESQVFIGSVFAELEEFTPKPFVNIKNNPTKVRLVKK